MVNGAERGRIWAAIVDGLTNGSSYTFTVTADTSAGTHGPQAATGPVTPEPVAPPRNVLPGKPQTVGYDQYSMLIGGRRVFVTAGEFDPWRTPSPGLWLDDLQKMKADGYNAVTVYFDWDYNSPSPECCGSQTFTSGPGAVNISGTDNYPVGFNCANTSSFGQPYGYPSYPGEPIYLPEFQGGSFDGWGGSGYDNCYTMTGPSFENVYYKNNIARGVTMHSSYMGAGGTNWGWLPANFVYSSYDYGAAIRETGEIGTPANPDDIAGSKYGENKLHRHGYHAHRAEQPVPGRPCQRHDNA